MDKKPFLTGDLACICVFKFSLFVCSYYFSCYLSLAVNLYNICLKLAKCFNVTSILVHRPAGNCSSLLRIGSKNVFGGGEDLLSNVNAGTGLPDITPKMTAIRGKQCSLHYSLGWLAYLVSVKIFLIAFIDFQY